MALYTIDDFWKIFEAVTGVDTSISGVTNAVDAIAKAERTRSEDLFNTVIDQSSFETDDYNRIRKFFIDLYSTHKTISTTGASASDPNSLPNTHLDELFRSFGYQYSVQLKDFDENPLPGKVAFFLDLVNLYKRKGTPQSLIDVLQYYGVTELDIYEFMLKFDNKNRLIFEGTAIAGTSEDPIDLKFFWPELTRLDPHWLLTEQQIRQLNANNINNLPSKTPYIGIQPIADADGPEISILSRLVQDEFDVWNGGGTLEDNAAITILGENHSLLELYLSCIYTFDKLYNVGKEGPLYACYDGTSIITADILAEYAEITRRPTLRNYDVGTERGILSGLAEYYDDFNRETPTNFLQNKGDAETYLNLIDAALKTSLDSLGEEDQVVLFSLLKDLAIWVRNNIGFGFVNLGFIMFGLDAFFSDLLPVVNFFKPYRARVILLEALQIKNRLFNTIVEEDENEFIFDTIIHDFLTGDSIPCCQEEPIDSTSTITVCLDSTAPLYYSRDTYDCGSYHDIGAVTDIPQELFIEGTQIIHDRLRCYHCPENVDTTTIVSCQSCSQFAGYDCLAPLMDGDGFVDGFYLEGNEDALPPVHDDISAQGTDATADVVYYSTGGMADYDNGASFDCTHGFDLVQIHTDFIANLLQENGAAILQENGGLIRLE